MRPSIPPVEFPAESCYYDDTIVESRMRLNGGGGEMKRLAWLLFIAILSFNTVAFTLPASDPTMPASPPAMPGRNVNCHNVGGLRLCASVSEATVVPGSFITIYGLMKLRGVGVAGQVMRVEWHGRTSATCVGVTDASGLASCTTYVPSNLVGGRIVNVKLRLDKYKVTTHFRIKDIDRNPESVE
jgi:hypothetical protein